MVTNPSPSSSTDLEASADAETEDGARSTSALPSATLTRPTPKHESPAWLNGVYAGICLYLFLSAINVMGSGLGALGNSTDLIERRLDSAENPFIALMGAVLITAFVQSSSFTTALIITLVASGQMQLQFAVFAVMGANIGTSVTNTIVSLVNVRIRRQFRKAFTAALLHDIFNWLTVAVLFPLEWITKAASSDGYGLLTRFSMWMAQLMGLGEMEKPDSPIKVITKPIVKIFEWLGEAMTGHEVVQAAVIAVLGLLLLLLSLVFMVKNLKGALLRRIENLFRRVFFRNDLIAYVVGALTTVLVQSSSVTTSLIVPLAGAGAVKTKRVFPYTLGANLGTTITGVIAASANPVAGAVTVAIAHVTFNLVGTIVWYPLKMVPIRLCRWYARRAARSKRYAFYFLFGVFFVFPVTSVAVTQVLIRLLKGS